MENYFKKIKILFSIFILLLIIGISGSVLIMKDNNFFTVKQSLQTINYLNYKMSFVYTNNKNLTATAMSIFNDDNSIIKDNNGNAKSIPVLLYHRIVKNPDGFNILLEDFRNQIFSLKKAGWQTVSIEDFYKFMQEKKELPDKSFLLTFDDGAKDSYFPVDPILKALNYNAVSFIITKYLISNKNEENSSGYYLSKNELSAMLKSGRWDIQSHSRIGHTLYFINNEGTEGNFFTNKLWIKDKGRIETEVEFKERIFNDFINSKNDLENEFKINIISFAYPLGDFGENPTNFPDAKKIVLNTIKSVYPMSFYQIWPGKDFTFNYPMQEQILIKRIEVRPYWSVDNLLKVLDTAKDKNLPYIDNFSDYNGWVKSYGQISIENNLMILESNSSDGNFVFLEGSYLWKNYILKAKINWIKGESVSLIARLKDDKNYVSCSFSGKKVRIEQYLNGKERIMTEKEILFDIPKEDLELGVAVNNDKIDCFINGKSVDNSYYLNPVLFNGGIGFKIWDSKINNSKIIVKEVFVEKIK